MPFYAGGMVRTDDGRWLTKEAYERECQDNYQDWVTKFAVWLPRINTAYKNRAGYPLGDDVLRGRSRFSLKQAVQLLNDMGIMVLDGFREIVAEDFPKHS